MGRLARGQGSWRCGNGLVRGRRAWGGKGMGGSAGGRADAIRAGAQLALGVREEALQVVGEHLAQQHRPDFLDVEEIRKGPRGRIGANCRRAHKWLFCNNLWGYRKRQRPRLPPGVLAIGDRRIQGRPALPEPGTPPSTRPRAPATDTDGRSEAGPSHPLPPPLGAGGRRTGPRPPQPSTTSSTAARAGFGDTRGGRPRAVSSPRRVTLRHGAYGKGRCAGSGSSPLQPASGSVKRNIPS